MIRTKLISKNGESIIEALVGLLIMALGIILLSTMIVASSRIVDKSNKRLESMYSTTNDLEGKVGDHEEKTITIELDGSSSSVEVDLTTTKNKENSFSLYSYELKGGANGK